MHHHGFAKRDARVVRDEQRRLGDKHIQDAAMEGIIAWSVQHHKTTMTTQVAETASIAQQRQEATAQHKLVGRADGNKNLPDGKGTNNDTAKQSAINPTYEKQPQTLADGRWDATRP